MTPTRAVSLSNAPDRAGDRQDVGKRLSCVNFNVFRDLERAFGGLDFRFQI